MLIFKVDKSFPRRKLEQNNFSIPPTNPFDLILDNTPAIGRLSRMFTNGDRGTIPGQVISKTQKKNRT